MIQVIDRIVNILQLLSENKNRQVPLSEIADTLEMNRATCANILKSLKDSGLVEQADYRGGYVLGDKLYTFAGVHNDPEHLLKPIKPILESLCRSVNESVMLAVIRNDKRILLHSIESNHKIQAKTIYETPAWEATTSIVIIARYDSEKLSRFVKLAGLPRKFWPDVTNMQQLRAALDKVASEPCTTVVRNHFACMAAPVFKDGEAIASLGYYLPDLRLTGGRKEILEASLIEAANKASEMLG